VTKLKEEVTLIRNKIKKVLIDENRKLDVLTLEDKVVYPTDWEPMLF